MNNSYQLSMMQKIKQIVDRMWITSVDNLWITIDLAGIT